MSVQTDLCKAGSVGSINTLMNSRWPCIQINDKCGSTGPMNK